MAKQHTKILAVTGTKGKTTISRTLAYALNAVLDEPVLSTDTDRVMLGNKIYATADDSKRSAGFLPTLCPGRYLDAIRNHTNPVAVFEESLSCGRSAGIGYSQHLIGMFTNVYDDHLGNRPDVKTREDLAKMKSFVFSRIGADGYAIYNPEEPLIVQQLSVLNKDLNIKKVACGLKERPAEADLFVTSANGKIVIHDTNQDPVAIHIGRFPWLLGGVYEPSLRNGMYVIAALYCFFSSANEKFEKSLDALESYVPEVTGGRMVIANSQDGYRVVLDFAHEAESLTMLGKYAQNIKAEGGKVIGVVRLSDDRPNDYIASVTKKFSPAYDMLVIYDKIDGHWRQSTANAKVYRRRRHVGEVSAIMLSAAKELGVAAEQIVREDEAMMRAAQLAKQGDVVVSIINVPERSYDMARRIFKLEVSNT